MEVLILTAAAVCVGAVFACLWLTGRSRTHAEDAEMAAEDAEMACDEARADAQTCLGVSGSITSFAEGEQSMASELRKEMQQLVGVMTAAVERCDEAQASLSVCQEWGKVCHEKAETAVSMAELVKVEVAKLTTMIDQLNKVRQDNPPFVAITYGESGEPDKAELNTFTPDGVPLSSLEWWPDHTSAGTPFQFAPAQANTVVVDDNEADLTTSEVTP